MAVFFSQCVLTMPFPFIFRDTGSYFRAQKLESVRQFETESAAILLDGILQMETAGWIEVFGVQQIIDAGRGFQVLDDVSAEESQVHNSKTGRIRAGQGIAGQVREDRVPGTGVLDLDSGKYFVSPERRAHV